MKLRILTAFTLAAFAASSGLGQDKPAERPRRLTAGAPAPAMQVGEWVKGTPISGFEKGKVYLLEFWAVWCGPCIGNIPHLTALQKKYRDDGLVVIGFASPDRAPDKPAIPERNSLEMVRDFVARQGDAMDYVIAFDLAARETFQSYFNTPRAPIPTAFIIGRDGHIVISGHPFYLDEVLADVMADRWDPVKGAERLMELQRLIRACDEAKDLATFKAARATLATRSAIYAGRTQYTELLWAIQEQDAGAANRVSERMIRDALDGELGSLAYTINQMLRSEVVKDPGKPYLALAGKMSEAHVMATKGRDPSALNLRAEWLVANGDLTAAIGFLRRAIDVEVESRNEHLKQRLAELEKLAAEQKK